MKIEALFTLRNPGGGGVIAKGVYSDKSEKGIPQVLIDEARRGADTVRVISGKLPPVEGKKAENEPISTQDSTKYTTTAEPETEEPMSEEPTTAKRKPRRTSSTAKK